MTKQTILVIMGPPGSGKGTQAMRIREMFALEHLSTGDVLRQEVKTATTLGVQAKAFLDRGELVPDNLVIDMVCERLKKGTDKKGFLLDGFPRTIGQAEALDAFLTGEGSSIKVAVNLAVPEEVLIQRISGRAEARSDDNPEVVKARLQIYRNDTLPLVDYYRQANRLADINGDQTPDQVFAAIEASLKGLM